MNNILRSLVFLVLLALPIAGQWYWYYSPIDYTPPEISSVENDMITLPQIDYRPFEDRPKLGQGHIVIDFSHNNNLISDDTASLQDLLEARGLTVDTFTGETDSLDQVLHGATGFIVMAPTISFSPAEQETITEFVADGGRILLAADPTRPISPRSPLDFFEGEGNLFDFFFPESAIPAINSLANKFGIVYYDDYVYNIQKNEGNYRNVKVSGAGVADTPFSDLTDVVVFTAHSLQAKGQPLLQGDENTQSATRRGETTLPVAVLTTEARVLALGDITFLTPAYHTIGQNNQFLSNIADWFAVDTRQRDLEDFPYLFVQDVDLVQAFEGLLNPGLIVKSYDLRHLFQEANLNLSLRSEPEPDHDVLYVATFGSYEVVESYLIKAGISITEVIEKVEVSDEVSSDEDDPSNKAEEDFEGTFRLDDSLRQEKKAMTDTLSIDKGLLDEVNQSVTDTEISAINQQSITTTSSITGSAVLSDDLALEEEGEEVVTYELDIPNLGQVGSEGTSLYLVNRQADQTVVIALAEDEVSMLETLDRLMDGDFTGCVLEADMALCSSGESQDSSNSADDQATTDEPGVDEETDEAITEGEDEMPAGAGSSIFILSADHGSEGVRTGAYELEAILSEFYAVTVWSVSSDGIPTTDDLEGYVTYILDYGDFAFDVEDANNFDILSVFGDLEASFMFIGAQPFPSPSDDVAEVVDIEVAQTDHPIIQDFSPGEVIDLAPSESGVPALVWPETTNDSEENLVLFLRGPNSDFAGRSVAAVLEDSNDARGMVVTVAFYRLPEDVQRTFVLNSIPWLVGE